MKRITERVPPRRKSRDVYVYFDNDQQANAALDALSLAETIDPVATRTFFDRREAKRKMGRE